MDIGVGQNRGRALANDELNNESPVALLSSSSRSSQPFQDSHSSRITSSPDPLGHDYESFLSKAGHRAVPSNDLSGAIGTLDDGQWVSSTAIELILNKLRFGDIRVFDPSFFAGDSTYSSIRITDEKLWVMPLLLSGDHWGLVTIENDARTVNFWDSQEDKAHESEARCIIDAFEQFVRTSRAIGDRSWAFDVPKCPQQENEDDSGIYTIVFAIYKIAGLMLPQSLDVGLWRQLLKRLLCADSAPPNTSNNETVGILSASNPPTRNAAFATSRRTAQQVSFPEELKLWQDPLECFKCHDKRLSSALRDARRHARLSADTQQCLEQIQRQMAAFHAQSVQQERWISEAIQYHRDKLSTHTRLGTSRSLGLLDTQLKRDETRHQHKLEEVTKLTAAVEGWKRAAQRCNAVHNHRNDLADSRRKALQDFSKELNRWSEGQSGLLSDVEALKKDIAAKIEL